MGKKNKSIQKKLDRITELKQLSEKALKIKKEMSKNRYNNFKEFNIRNLKFFGHTCNFVMPFVVSAGLVSGGFAIFGGGLPFRTDKITKYKLYNLDYNSKAYVLMNEEYKTDRFIDDELPSSSLVIYTPYELIDNEYVRYKRVYDLEYKVTLDLYNAIINEDYSFIENNLNDYKEEKQVINKINEEDNDIIVEANLHLFDKEDKLLFDESEIKNIIITIIEVILGIGIGGFATWLRDYEYFYEIKKINKKYHLKIKKNKSLKKELEKVNKRILKLSNKVGKK